MLTAAAVDEVRHLEELNELPWEVLPNQHSNEEGERDSDEYSWILKVFGKCDSLSEMAFRWHA